MTNLLIALVVLFVGVIGWYFVEVKASYKVKNWIWTYLFFIIAFAARLHEYDFISPIFNEILFWICLVDGFWHLTKACFFIDEKELDARKIKGEKSQ